MLVEPLLDGLKDMFVFPAGDPMARLQALVFCYTKILLADILRFRISVIRVDVGGQDLFYGVRTDAEVF